YEVRARWMENGQQVSQTRTIRFHPGDQLMVNFLASQSLETRGTTPREGSGRSTRERDVGQPENRGREDMPRDRANPATRTPDEDLGTPIDRSRDLPPSSTQKPSGDRKGGETPPSKPPDKSSPPSTQKPPE